LEQLRALKCTDARAAPTPDGFFMEIAARLKRYVLAVAVRWLEPGHTSHDHPRLGVLRVVDSRL